MSREYEQVQSRLASGWNTFDTRSVLTHVRMPHGAAIALGLKEYRGCAYLREALIGRQGDDVESIRPGPHAYDGSYTQLSLAWHGIEIEVETATDGDDWVALIRPVRGQIRPAGLLVEMSLRWNRPGVILYEADTLAVQTPDETIRLYSSRPTNGDNWTGSSVPNWCIELCDPVALSTGRPRSVNEVGAILARQRQTHERTAVAYGEHAESYRALQTCLAWDTIYEPRKERVVSTVSRIWNCTGGGYQLFCWDTYFAAYMAALDNRELAYANAVEITREQAVDGFVPNCGHACFTSHDRSQPPVGSGMVREIYRRYREDWFVEDVFDALLQWNRWWPKAREVEGFLCWGSHPFSARAKELDPYPRGAVNEHLGAAYESGLDNSPMYDDAPFDEERHCLLLADVGLNGLYAWDCACLADLARVIGRDDEASELHARAEDWRTRVNKLWDETAGIYLNRRLDTGAVSTRRSPTNFYPLLARSANTEQATRMMRDHLTNPNAFGGEWVLPSISRDDPAYGDQQYWRGRVWAPMNFLVYLGLCQYEGLQPERTWLSDHSEALLLKEWTECGHVHENYNADTGEGCDQGSSDRFYHWGGLLGTIALIESGHYANPAETLPPINPSVKGNA